MVSAKDADRLFMQALLSRRLVSEKLGNLLYTKCTDAVKASNDSVEFPRNERVGDVVHRLQQNLQPLGMDIKVVMDEYTGTQFYAVVNLQGGSIAEIATSYAPNEVQYFKALVEQIMLARNEAYCIGSIAALRAASGMTRNQAQSLLKSFVHESWLTSLENGSYYVLGPRSEAELETYLKNHYEDLGFCKCISCGLILTRGLRCCSQDCNARIHHSCLNRHTMNNREYQCRLCSADWSGRQNHDRMQKIGAEAFREGQDAHPMKRPQAATADNSDDENSEEGEGEDPVEPNTFQGRERGTNKSERVKKAPKASGSRRHQTNTDHRR